MSKGTALYIRQLSPNGVAEEQILWAVRKFDFTVSHWDRVKEQGHTTSHEASYVVTSRAVVPSLIAGSYPGYKWKHTPEILVFPADAEGDILNFGELGGDQGENLTHEQILRDMGYEV